MILVQGRYAYVANTAGDVVQVVDISNPASPSVVGSITAGTDPIALAINGRYLYVENYNSTNIQVFDVGGTYTQSLESGNLYSGTLQVSRRCICAGQHQPL